LEKHGRNIFFGPIENWNWQKNVSLFFL